ncbi:MAG: kynureninase [Planctomycetota bacterium]
MTTRDHALELDTQDPLARFRDEFVVAEPGLLYLDGNSLGRLSHRAAAAAETAVRREWGEGLVRSWHEWLHLPAEIGDRLAPLVGAGPGEVMLCDQTSVNLFKLAWAGLRHSGRTAIVGDDSNFPSDRYVLAAVAQAAGGEYREVAVDPVVGPTADELAMALNDAVGLVSLSLVSFKSGAIADLRGITDLARRHGALVLWDLSHAAGVLPVGLAEAGADLAVGCTYKHLNGGPGAPAFLYVRQSLQTELHQPIPGWFGHDDMFAFDAAFRPAPDIRRFAVGTPPIVSLRCAQAGIEVSADAGIEAIRAKCTGLTELLIERFDARLAPLGFELASPRDPEQRAGHVSLSFGEGYRVVQAMIARGCVPDFRAPSLIRLGLAPLYNRFVEVFDAVELMAEIVERGEHLQFEGPKKGSVT